MEYIQEINKKQKELLEKNAKLNLYLKEFNHKIKEDLDDINSSRITSPLGNEFESRKKSIKNKMKMKNINY